jgi:hypothetical protein
VNLEVEDCFKYRPIHWACSSGNIRTVKLLVHGFISDKIYSFPSKVNLRCLTNNNKTPLDLTFSDKIREFIQTKLEMENRTIFIKKDNFYDIQFD